MWFVGLSSAELHMARVRSRVARGGHDIPEERIRERYDRSRINLIELMPRLTELKVYDNSFEADPHAGPPRSRPSFFTLRRGRSWRWSSCQRRLSGPRLWWPQRSRSRSKRRGRATVLCCCAPASRGRNDRYNHRRRSIEGSRESSEDDRRTTAFKCVVASSWTRAGRSAFSRQIDLATAKEPLILVAHRPHVLRCCR
jgi:hypothetical protein